MTPLDDQDGIWKKSGTGKGRKTTKGRQVDDVSVEEVRALLGDRARRRDHLIEFLHLIQDRYGHLSAAHIAALADEMRMAQTEIYEVATFYAHFDIVKEGEAAPPALTIRVCDSLSCEMAGAQALKSALEGGLDPAEVRVLRAPCMGRCDTAPVLEIWATTISTTPRPKRSGGDRRGRHACACPAYQDFEAYRAAGGYAKLAELRERGDFETVQQTLLDAGVRGSAGRGSRRARNGASCGPRRGRVTWPSTATRASRAPSRTAITSSASRMSFSRGC